MSENKNCPQCKARATNRDIRFIYASKIKVVDNSREINLLETVKKLTEDKNHLIIEAASSSIKIATQVVEIRKLREEIDQLRYAAQTSQGRATAGIRTIKTGRMYLEKNLDFKENLESRWIQFMTRSKKLVVSQKSAGTALFSGFGVKLIDFETYRQEKFINTSNKAVHDFTVDSSEAQIVTVSQEATCKMYNLSSNASVSSFTPAAVPIWSCSFDKERPHNLYIGVQNSHTYVYDLRNPNQVFKEIVPLNNRSPVRFVIPIKITESFPHGGFYVVHVRGLFFYEYLPSGEISSTTLNFKDPINAASYDDRTEMLLITTSVKNGNAAYYQTRHILMKLIKEEGIPLLQEIYSFDGSKSELPSMSRPTQIKVPDSYVVASYLHDRKMLQARSPPAGLLHEVAISDAITDVCPIYLENSYFFAALSNSRCRFFKINLGY